MSLPVEDLAAQALHLPPEDRAKLVERLLASFEAKSAAHALTAARRAVSSLLEAVKA